MKSIVMLKVLRKLLILGVLITSLLFIATSNKIEEPAAAAQCCSTCERQASICYARPDPSTCLPGVNYCFNHCIDCENDLPPGCDSSSGGSGNSFCQSWGYSSCSSSGYCTY
ncbi:MAG TPA: hypothetical protein VF648_07385 [Pyrinomonadaceae bacterium]|jgi:hypothetical protein